jgi:transcription termination factor NusB
MAGRRRARRFAIQLLYSLDCKEEALRSNLKTISAIGGRIGEGVKLRRRP